VSIDRRKLTTCNWHFPSHCSQEYFNEPFSIGLSLHACGVATDLVLRKCWKIRASFICSPCCYGKIQNLGTLPQSKVYQEVLTAKDLLIVSHCSDQTHDQANVKHASIEKSQQGFACMDVIDTDRLGRAKELGYLTQLKRLFPEDCTLKNRLLVGVYPSWNVLRTRSRGDATTCLFWKKSKTFSRVSSTANKKVEIKIHCETSAVDFVFLIYLIKALPGRFFFRLLPPWRSWLNFYIILSSSALQRDNLHLDQRGPNPIQTLACNACGRQIESLSASRPQGPVGEIAGNEKSARALPTGASGLRPTAEIEQNAQKSRA
jgi:hypothetical protein